MYLNPLTTISTLHHRLFVKIWIIYYRFFIGHDYRLKKRSINRANFANGFSGGAIRLNSSAIATLGFEHDKKLTLKI
jgi:hypothetical protein